MKSDRALFIFGAWKKSSGSDENAAFGQPMTFSTSMFCIAWNLMPLSSKSALLEDPSFAAELNAMNSGSALVCQQNLHDYIQHIKEFSRKNGYEFFESEEGWHWELEPKIPDGEGYASESFQCVYDAFASAYAHANGSN